MHEASISKNPIFKILYFKKKFINKAIPKHISFLKHSGFLKLIL